MRNEEPNLVMREERRMKSFGLFSFGKFFLKFRDPLSVNRYPNRGSDPKRMSKVMSNE